MTDAESFELNFSINYKDIKQRRTEWFYGPIHHSSKCLTSWRLQIHNSHPDYIGAYVTLLNGAPCTVQSYQIFMLTTDKSPLMAFISQCTLQRTFPDQPFSWGFENFCTRKELKEQRKLVCNRKTKLIHLRCTMLILSPSLNHPHVDHRFATDLFHTRSLEEWIEFLKHQCDLPELENRVNQEIESRLP